MAKSPLDLVIPGNEYIAKQEFRANSAFMCWLPKKTPPDFPGYPWGKHDDANKPTNLFVGTPGSWTTLPAGTKLKVDEVTYHAQSTLRKGTMPEGAYQCVHVVSVNGKPCGPNEKGLFVWTVYNGWALPLDLAGPKAKIAPGKTLTCTLTVKTTPSGYQIVEPMVCSDATGPCAAGSATVVVQDSAKNRLEDVLVVLEDELGGRWQAVTQKDGLVELHGLEPGEYVIETAFDGWKACP